MSVLEVHARQATISKRTLMLGVGATMIVLASASQSHAQNKNISVTIQPTGTALPVVVADKKGMFAKHDVQVKWSVSRVQISDSIATLGRQFDIMMGTQPALIAAAGQGIPVVIVSGGGLDTPKHPMANIVARGGSGITTFKQLDGKTVGTLSLTGNIHFALLNILHKEGVDHNKIQWVLGTVPQLPDLLRAGRVDAIEEIEPFATFAIQAGGTALGDPFRSIGDRAFIGLWLAQRDWANKNQDLTLRFNSALAEAATWIHANLDEAKEILSSYTGLKGTALEKTPLPEYHFSTTAADLAAQHRPDLRTWNEILGKTSDIKPVKVDDLLPSWAQK